MEDRAQYEQADVLFNDNMVLAEMTLYKVFPKPRATARRKGLDVEDLMQYAYTGLWKACISFDPDKKVKFRTHAINHIRWHLIEKAKREGNPLKLDANKKYNFSELHKIVSFDRVLEDLFEGAVTLHDIHPADVDVEYDVLDEMRVVELLNVADNEVERAVVSLRAQEVSYVEIAKRFGSSSQNMQAKMRKMKDRIAKFRNSEVSYG
jgi:RNA polymerase sigma factor (sigma-70 family)